jgi:hypothetical protein
MGAGDDERRHFPLKVGHARICEFAPNALESGQALEPVVDFDARFGSPDRSDQDFAL